MRSRIRIPGLVAMAVLVAAFGFLAARALSTARLEVVTAVRARLASEAQAAAATAGRRLDGWLEGHLVEPAAWRIGAGGRFVRPPEPMPFTPLRPPPEMPEGLLALLRRGEAAELTDGGLSAAAGFYREAVSAGGPDGFHRVALARLAAVTGRLGDADRARDLWTEAAAVAGETELALAAAIEGADVPEDDLVAALVRHLSPGSATVATARTLGLLDRVEVRRRLADLARMDELRPHLRPLPPDGEVRHIRLAEGAGFQRGEIVAIADADTLARILGPAATPPGAPPDPPDTLREEAPGAGPLREVRFAARAGPDEIEIAVRRQGALLLLAVGLAALTAVAALAFLLRSVRREAELAALKTDFVANVSHELRTPLARIRLYAETLGAGLVPEGEEAEYIAIVTREAADLTRLVDGVLDFARIEKGTKAYRLEPGDLAAFVREVGDEARTRPGAGDLEVEVPAAEVRARFDPDALARAIGNLLDNAGTHAGGTGVVLALRPLGNGTARIEVADRGPGIPPGETERIFDRFHRGRTAASGGSGLGLTLVRHAARGHGGKAGCEPREGGGTVFFLRIPADAGKENGR